MNRRHAPPAHRVTALAAGARALAPASGSNAQAAAGARVASPLMAATAAWGNQALMQSLGTGLGALQVRTGEPSPGGRNSARAAAWRDRVEFRDPHPAPSLVAHELAHVVQLRRGLAPTLAGQHALVDSRVSLEAEAGAAARQMALGGVFPIRARAAEAVLFDDPPRRRGANELRAALNPEGDQALLVTEVLAILRENALPEHMASLRSEYGANFFRDLSRVLGDHTWGEARGYLGAQLTLAENIQTRTGILIHDQAGVMDTLQRWPDADVLRMIEEAEGVPAAAPASPPPAPAAPAPGAGVSPARGSWADVQAALAAALDSDGQYRAMQILLGKAQRAQAARPAPPVTSGAAPGPSASLDPVGAQRVALALARIAAADANGQAADAYLALADLSDTQRAALRPRLDARHWGDLRGTVENDLKALAATPDTAQAVARALRAAGNAGSGHVSPAMLEQAAGRAGELIAQARTRLAALPANASAEERARATAELTALQARFHEHGLVSALYFASHETGEATLTALGAPPEQIAQLTVNRLSSFEDMLAWLRRIPADRRLAVTQSEWYQSKYTQLLGIHPDPHSQALLLAALYEGNQQLAASDAGNAFLQGQQTVLDVHDIVQSWTRGEFAHVWVALGRMAEPRRDRLAAHEDMTRFVNGLANGTAEQMVQAFRLRRGLRGQSDQLLREDAFVPVVRGGHVSLRIGDPHALIELLDRSPQAQAGLRRGMVVRHRLQANPALEVTPEDRELADRYDALALAANELGDRDHALREALEAVAYGEPELLRTEGSPQDPSSEAEYMSLRLEDRLAALRPAGSAATDLLSWAGPNVDEAATQFRVLYGRLHTGGVSRGELAQLADLYYRAMQALGVFAPVNQQFASTAAMLVAAVVGTVVVSGLSGGTLGPVAVGALAAFASGAAAGLTGLAVRGESTTEEVLTDTATGAVEGAVSIASAALAARIVHGAAVGRAAGQAARMAGGGAVRAATGGLGATVAESVIDGAIGGASGELFQTAIDEATWNHGVAAAFASLLAALARGASFGAAGGAVGGLIGHVVQRMAARLGRSEAEALGRLLGDAHINLEGLSDDALVAVHQASRRAALGDIDGAQQALRAVTGLAPLDVERIESVLRRLHIVRSGLDIGERDAAVLARQIVEVDDAEFLRHASDPRAHAVMTVENGAPRVYVRRGTPPTAVREEIQHLMQWQTDPLMRARMAHVASVDAQTWNAMPAVDRAQLVREHLFVEADAQRRILQNVQARALAGDALAEGEWMAADEALFLMNRRIEELDRALAHPESLNLQRLRLDDPTPPRFYARGPASQPLRELTAQQHANLSRFAGRTPEEAAAELGAAGYVLHRDGQRIIRIQRPPGGRAGDLPHLSIGGDGRITRGTVTARNHEDLRRDAALMWTAQQEALARTRVAVTDGSLGGTELAQARAALATNSNFRGQLERWVAAGTLGPADAGLLLGWGGFVEELVNTSKTPLSRLRAMRNLPRSVGGLTDSAYGAFRRELRAEAAEVLAAVPDGTRRMDALQRLSDALPDNRSRGELFTAFRQRMWGAEAGTTAGLDVQPFEFPQFATPSHTRTPDDVVRIARDQPGWMRGGRYAVEDKTGPGAFGLEQAQDYARTAAAGRGLRLRPDAPAGSDYDGLIYMFSNVADAQRALEQMQADALVRPLLGRHPGGIHVAAFNPDGTRRLLTRSPVLTP